MLANTLENLKQNLTYAYKWMAQATASAKQGDFNSANYEMTVALQYWARCQHIQDKHIEDEESDKIHWDFISTQALNEAKQMLEKDE